MSEGSKAGSGYDERRMRNGGRGGEGSRVWRSLGKRLCFARGMVGRAWR